MGVEVTTLSIQLKETWILSVSNVTNILDFAMDFQFNKLLLKSYLVA